MPKKGQNNRERKWSSDSNYPSSSGERGFSDSSVEGWTKKEENEAWKGWKMSRQFGRKGDPRYIQKRYLTKVGYRCSLRAPKKQKEVDQSGYQADLEIYDETLAVAKTKNKQQQKPKNAFLV
jgi:hypothetical protein